MATIVIRDLDPEVKARLRRQAAANGRSMEAEARAVLGEAVGSVRPPRGLGSYIQGRFAAIGGVDLEIPKRTGDAPAADLS